MKCLYYCTTPFQLLTALNMQFNHIIPSEAENEKADIIVANIFKNAEDISRRIKNTKLFNNVYLINEEDHKNHSNGFSKAFAIARNTMFPGRLLKQQFNCKSIDFLKQKYNVIVSSVFSHTVAALLTLNRNAEYIMMDDGMASYFGNWTKRIRSPGYLKFLKLRNLGKEVDSPSSLYVMRRDMCNSELSDTILQLPEFSSEFLKVAFSVFGMSDVFPNYNQKVIWLTHVSNSEKKREGTYEIARALTKYSNDVVVRKHPRQKLEDAYSNFECDNGAVMWELLLSKFPIKKKLIITLGSTGAFTPKFLYNDEPWLLFTYKLIPLPNGSQLDDFLSIVEQLKKAYTHPEHILEPETWDEFDSFVKTFISETEDIL